MRISEVYYPATIAEILELLRRNPDIQFVAGGTEIVGSQTDRALDLRPQLASIAKTPELRRTVRNEQFLETGCCTTLTGLLTLAPGLLPHPIPDLVRSIANHGIRNIATIGGNLCSRQRFMDLWPLLACMDAQAELLSPAGARWINISHFCNAEGLPDFPKTTLLARIRIPLYAYNFVFFKKLGAWGYPGPETALFICLANIQRERIEDFRLIFAGLRAFRQKDTEMLIVGKKTGIPAREARALVQSYIEAFQGQTWFDQRVFSALVEENFRRLFPWAR